MRPATPPPADRASALSRSPLAWPDSAFARRSRRAYAVLLAILPIACGEGGSESSQPATETTTTANAPLLVLERAQSFSDVPGDSARLRSIGLVTLTSDAVLVADTVARRIRRFSRDGRAAAVIGAAGVGPGQMQAISAIAASADTIFVFDPQLWRISAFDTAGILILTRRAEPRAGSPLGAARTADGSWLVLEGPAPSTSETGAVGHVVRWSITASTWTAIAQIPVAQVRSADAPGRAALWAGHSTGDFWSADPERYAITHYSATGESLSSVAVSTDARPREVRVSGDGELWVRIDTTADSVEWHVFDTSGEMRYRVRLPRGAELQAILGDTVIASGRESADASFYLTSFIVRR